MEMKNHGGVLANVIGVLVVCVIVATIFFMISASTRECINSREAQCESNIKECAIALHLYADDYDGCLPSSYLVSHSKKWNKQDFLTFATKRGELSSSANQKTWAQILYKYMRYKDVLYCPVDTTPQNDPNVKVSYWWKIAIDKAWYGEECTKTYRNFNDYEHECDQIVLYERNGWHREDTNGLDNDTQIKAAFLDTHVRTITLKNATSGDPVNCAANSDGEPMYFNYSIKKDAGLADDKAPAKFVDPGRYSDEYRWDLRKRYMKQH